MTGRHPVTEMLIEVAKRKLRARRTPDRTAMGLLDQIDETPRRHRPNRPAMKSRRLTLQRMTGRIEDLESGR